MTVDLDAVPAPTGVPLTRWLNCFPSFGFLLCVPAGREGECLAAFAGRDLDRVAGSAARDHVGAEQLAQVGHVHLQPPAGAARRLLAPGQVDQPVLRHHPAGAEQQCRQHRRLFRSGRAHRPGRTEDRDRSEQQIPQRRSFLAVHLVPLLSANFTSTQARPERGTTERLTATSATSSDLRPDFDRESTVVCALPTRWWT